MDAQEQAMLLNLLTRQRVASLAVTVDLAPFVSLVPFALTGDRTAVLIHASRLARHSAGLTAGASFSLLIHQPDCQPQTNPAQLARVALQGTVHPIAPDSAAFGASRDEYLTKFPKSAITFGLGDFTLYKLEVESCRFVAGFARTFDLSITEIVDLSPAD